MAVTRVTIGGEGPSEQSMPSSKGFTSSDDYASGGITVRNTNNTLREVHSKDDLSDTDVIEVQGMSMRVAQAKELGLLNTVFDDGLSLGAARRAAQEHSAEPVPEENQGSNTGHAEYDNVIDGLSASLEDEIMTPEESATYETAFGQIAMSGLSMDEAFETVRGLSDGSLSELDVPSDTRAMLTNVQNTIDEAATQSALKELGQEGFEFLQQAASTNAGVDRVIRQFAVDRAAGQADGITWADFAQHIREQLGH